MRLFWGIFVFWDDILCRSNWRTFRSLSHLQDGRHIHMAWSWEVERCWNAIIIQHLRFNWNVFQCKQDKDSTLSHDLQRLSFFCYWLVLSSHGSLVFPAWDFSCWFDLGCIKIKHTKWKDVKYKLQLPKQGSRPMAEMWHVGSGERTTCHGRWQQDVGGKTGSPPAGWLRQNYG